jgi:Protein of unknown function (DUF3313)
MQQDSMAMNIYRLAVMLVLSSALVGCSSAPKTNNKNFLSRYDTLEKYKEQSNYSNQRYINKTAVAKARTVYLGNTSYQELALPEGIDVKQIALVANAIDREVCEQLAPHYEIVDEQQTADLRMRASLTAVRSTNKTAAVVSSVVGLASPVWIRPPTGMGALAGEAEFLDSAQQQNAAIVWSRGAASFTEGESISSIGDAYQLAGRFAKDIAKLVVDSRKKTKNAKQLTKTNLEKCVARYGKNKVGGTVAGLFLPMSPESKDAGKPDMQAPTTVQPVETIQPTSATELEPSLPTTPTEVQNPEKEKQERQ